MLCRIYCVGIVERECVCGSGGGMLDGEEGRQVEEKPGRERSDGRSFGGQKNGE